MSSNNLLDRYEFILTATPKNEPKRGNLKNVSYLLSTTVGKNI